MTITTTGKIALTGAGMVTLIAIAIASNSGPDSGDVSINVAAVPTTETTKPAIVWSEPSKRFFDDLAAVGIDVRTDSDEVKGNVATYGQVICNRYKKPGANKQDTAAAIHREIPAMTSEQAMAMANSANANYCPETVVALAPVVVELPNVNVPRVNPPNVHVPHRSKGESRFCSKRWWC